MYLYLLTDPPPRYYGSDRGDILTERFSFPHEREFDCPDLKNSCKKCPDVSSQGGRIAAQNCSLLLTKRRGGRNESCRRDDK